MLADDIRNKLKPLTATGGDYEMGEEEIRGQKLRIFPRHPQTLGEYLKHSCRQRADTPFMSYEDEHYSFGDSWKLAGQLGHMLQQKYGIAKGDRVAIAMRNYPEWVLAYMAVVCIGAVAVPLNAWWVRREMEYGLKDAGAKLLIADQQRYEIIAADLPQLGLECICVRFAEKPAEMADLMELIGEAAGAEMPAVEIHPEDDASIMYTSGTTGFPKGALASHRSVMAALHSFQFTAAAVEYLQPPASEAEEDADAVAKKNWQAAMLLTVPLFHVTGCVAIMLASFGFGRKMVMMYKWDAADALRLIESERITAFTGVPTMVWEMLQHQDFDRYDLSSMTSIGGGGAPAPVGQVKRVSERFAGGQPGIGYGLTETNAVTSINSGAMYLLKPTSCGMPTLLGDVHIEDEKGRVLAANEEGEICIRGAFVITGYWNRPDDTEKALQKGWFHSGDVGYMDEDGFLYISSRAKDMILRGGENVYCAEVESAVYEFPGIYECAVFGVPDQRLGEKVAVAVMPVPGKSIDEEEFKAFLSEQIARFKVPEFVFVHSQQLPRNASGKILRKQLREEAISQLGLQETG